MRFPFLPRLTLRLIAGAAALPTEQTAALERYVMAAQKPDGGWGGREGGSDLYYTAFALRSLAVLGGLHGETASRAADYLRGSLATSQGVVDLVSLIYAGQLIAASAEIDAFEGFAADWDSRVVAFFDSLRREDGGFAKSPDSRLGSTYQTFLVALCRELFDRPLGSDDPCVAFRLGQRQADGGFLEVRVAKRSGTNPTAAAAVALGCIGALEPHIARSAAGFLLDQQTDGGFAANTRMPMPDLLSTFTALTALWDLGQMEQADLAAARDYAESMRRPEGGFAGFELDPAHDVEYSFYGLGTLALLASS